MTKCFFLYFVCIMDCLISQQQLLYVCIPTLDRTSTEVSSSCLAVIPNRMKRKLSVNGSKLDFHFSLFTFSNVLRLLFLILESNVYKV